MAKSKENTLKKVIKIFIRTVVSILALILMIWLLIQVTPVQNWIVKKVTTRLSNDLHTEISIRHIDISLFNSMNLEGTLVKDLNKDTLLYADKLKMRVTDWFFLKDELVLKYIGLEDAYINMYRTDSVWNYQFLADYFSPKKLSPKKKSTLKLNLKKIDFKNIAFIKKDGWVGSTMMVKLGNMQLEAESFDLEKNVIGIKELVLDKPFFLLSDYDGKRPPLNKKKKEREVGEMYFNESGLHLTVDNLLIKNGTFENLKNPTRKAYSYFDAAYLHFEKINGSFKNVSFIKDTIQASIDISTKERSGFELRKLKANFRLTPEVMEFAKLEILTPKSHLQHYYAMHFKNFNRDFSDFEEKVTMEAKFSDATINSDDIAFFAPNLKTWKKQIIISGYGKGLLGDLVTKNLFVKVGANTVLSGDLTIKGLPIIATTFFDLQNGSLQTSYKDAAMLIPAIAQVETPSLSSLGNVKYKGNFKGTISKFAANGVYSTNLGGFSANIAMELPDKAPSIYSGHVATQRFDIGRFLRIKNMGTVTFDGTIKGLGLTLNTLKTSVTGKISQFQYNDYGYKKIDVEGTFQKKQFDGTVKIDDENIDFVTTVKMDFRGAQPNFNVLGDLSHSDFRLLNLAQKDLHISGLFDLNFTGKNIDNFLGFMKVYNASLVQDSVRLDLDSLSLQSKYENGNRFLSLSSNQFEASVDGQYNILDLPNTFQIFLHNYYPAYIAPPTITGKNQRFNFLLNTKNVEGYTRLVSKDISGFSNSSVTGTINTFDTVFEIHADVPEFAIGKNHFTNIALTGQGNYNQLQLNGNIGNILMSDSSSFPNTNIKILSKKDRSSVSIKTKATNTLNELNLNADVTTYPDGVKINLNPSDFVINDKRWQLEKEGEIVIRKDIVSAENVRFTQNDQHIEIATTHDALLNQDNLKVKLQNVNIGDFAPLITASPRMEGLLTGDVLMRDFFGKFKVESDLKAEQFRLDNDSVGVVNVKGNYNSISGKIDFKVASENEAYNFNADGSYDLKDTTGKPLMTSMKLNNTKVTILNKFLNTIFTDIEGYASGDLHINGNPSKPELLGTVTLKNGSLLVNFTKVRYEVDSATFVFANDGINFGRFAIKDKFGNTGIVSGKLYEKQLQNMRFDLDISTSRMLLIDTKLTDNPQFYGNAIGKANMTITGPQQNMRLGITAQPVDSSQIYIPITNSRESGKASFIVFKQYGTEMKDLSVGETNITVDLDLTANPLAKIDVILDPATGDIIKANGNGRLKIHAGTTDPLTIKGRYEVVKGSYDFNFQSFIKKPFIFQENSGSYIEWNGDPYNAKLQVNAVYVAENVRLGDLVSNQNLSGNVQSYQGQVYVIANISGNLKQPDIQFSIDFPQGSQVKNDETFNQFLTKLERDDNEMLKQVTYLIVFGSFAPYGETKAPNVTSLGINTISGVIANYMNGIISNLLRKTGFQLDVNASVYNSSSLFGGTTASSPNTFDRGKLDVKLNKQFFNNKLIITVGSDVDFNANGNSATSQQLGNLQLLPDVTVEFILSRDRKVRAIVFSRNNLDVSTAGVGRRNRTGASISYRKDFNHLFSKPKKKEEKPVDVPSSAILPASNPEKEEN